MEFVFWAHSGWLRHLNDRDHGVEALSNGLQPSGPVNIFFLFSSFAVAIVELHSFTFDNGGNVETVTGKPENKKPDSFG